MKHSGPETDLQVAGEAPTWNPSATKIAYTGADGKIYEMNPDATDNVSITTPPLGMNDVGAHYSPDVQMLVFMRQVKEVKDKDNGEILRLDHQAKVEMDLTNSPGMHETEPVHLSAGACSNPEWAPEGKALARSWRNENV